MTGGMTRWVKSMWGAKGEEVNEHCHSRSELPIPRLQLESAHLDCLFLLSVGVEGSVDVELSRRSDASAGVWSKGGKYQDVLDEKEGRKEAKRDEGQVFLLCGRREGAAADPESNREGRRWKEREKDG